ncbi:CaiB/BaiF CoA transferase family protein [Yoonia sp.]|uniref:CaiB/BaiF CoA transferase family protein n=1 Tax=Yoonia sp. TaxID=2212373 RepID=UPI002FDB1AA1
MQPLAGLKVIELARVLAGPLAGQTLADLGAEVIKIESPQGDDTRQWGPPFITHDGAESAAYFHCCNRGKKSVVIDLRTPEGQAQVRTLVADADILLENFKVGGLAKYGLDYASLSAVNPRLIYCSITGFGQTGPYAKRAGYDFIVQGMSGLMSVTGDPAGQPQKVGVAVTDLFTGIYACTGILAAVHQRQTTGKGQHIDMALLDVATAIMTNQAMNYLATGTAPQRAGNTHPNIMPYQVFDCADGHIIVAVGNDSQYRHFCELLGVPDLGTDPAYATNTARLRNREVLTDLLTAETMKRSKQDLLAGCESYGVPAGPINNMAEAFADPQVIHRGMRIDLDGVPSVRLPITFTGEKEARQDPSPRLGKHQDLLD